MDTCCIDKRFDAELSMAVRSMADWYRASELCVVYMNDVPALAASTMAGTATDSPWLEHFARSQWFYRGWTLQELVFSPNVVFYSRHWHHVDEERVRETSGMTMPELLSTISGIPEECLKDSRRIFEYSIAARMSWASQRTTTRKEDEAYCLMGIFAIRMEIMYGEGNHAFFRPQTRILEKCDDESIFAWRVPGEPAKTAAEEPFYALLALEPKAFKGCGNISRDQDIDPGRSYAITNAGLRLSTTATKFQNPTLARFVDFGEILLIALNCTQANGQDPDGTEVREVCFIALADVVQKGYGPGYVRLFAWSTGASLYRYLRHPSPNICAASTEEDLPRQVYHVAYAPSIISASRLCCQARPHCVMTLENMRQEERDKEAMALPAARLQKHSFYRVDWPMEKVQVRMTPVSETILPSGDSCQAL